MRRKRGRGKDRGGQFFKKRDAISTQPEIKDVPLPGVSEVERAHADVQIPKVNATKARLALALKARSIQNLPAQPVISQ